MDEMFVCQCIADTLDGLRDGLSHFSGPSRAAVMYAVRRKDPMVVYDPQHLLRGHEPKFRELYLDSDHWRERGPQRYDRKNFGLVIPETNLQLAGLVSFGGRSGSVFFQMWFTEHHLDMCAVGPTERWLEHAVWRVSHDIANGRNLYTGISGTFLREYATHAVRDYIVDTMNVTMGWDSHLRIYPILDAILSISRTREEGQWARGKLTFVEPSSIPEVGFVARFPQAERPSLENFKHVRKLLQAVERSSRKLVSDGKTILGIADNGLPAFHITAEFRGGHGFLSLPQGRVCSFSDGSFKSNTRKANLVQLEEALLEADLGPSAGHLYRIIADIVHSAETHRHGCTIVIDLNQVPVMISGQKLEKALDLGEPEHSELAKSLAAVDGALHVTRDGMLIGFACLLDGRAILGEDRARGARFNSALRFAAEQSGIIVVVVSSDRPVSVIQEGVELSAQCQWRPISGCVLKPPTLSDWIKESEMGGIS